MGSSRKQHHPGPSYFPDSVFSTCVPETPGQNSTEEQVRKLGLCDSVDLAVTPLSSCQVQGHINVPFPSILTQAWLGVLSANNGSGGW